LLGEVVEFPAPDNAGKYAGAVAQIGEDAILFDFNHPLAGQAVSLEVQVIGVL
jgi:FKBP-type peptidyl-prolyl cis-trans isomerase SlpA